jgi:hypothetical protein
MLLPENKAYDFIAAYTNLLHYAGATHGLVPEEQSMEEFTKGGTALLVECRELLIEDPGLLDEFAADGAAEHPDFFFPMLHAVGRMRPIQARILRDTPEHTICFDVDAAVFYHVKSLTEPLGLKMGRPYPLVEMMLMTYDGVVAHDGLVRHLALVPALTESAVGELEAMYAEAVKEARIAKPWGPGTGKLDPAILAQPHIKAIIGSAAMLHPEFAAPFLKLTKISPDEETFLELILETVLVLRHKPYKELRSLFETVEPPEHDLILFTLDRIEGDVHALLRKTRRKTKVGKRKGPERTNAARTAPAVPVTLAERLNAATPFTVSGTRALSQIMRERGTPITLKSRFPVVSVEEGPDDIGIVCVLGGIDMKENVVASITHLVLPTGAPLFAEAADYQRKRIKRLAKRDRYS